MAPFNPYLDLNLPPLPDSPISFTQPPTMDANQEITFQESMDTNQEIITFQESMRNSQDLSPLDSISETLMANPCFHRSDNPMPETLPIARELSSNEINRGLDRLDPISGTSRPVHGENEVSIVDRGSRCIEKRSRDLVRMDNLTPEELRKYEEEVRRTRMIYESLRISFSSEEEQPRPNLYAGTQMRIKGLWLNRDKRVLGSIPGVKIGDVFFNRIELCMLGLHGLIQAGIDFLEAKRHTRESIATSIIVDEGHEDNEDYGNTIIYVGQNNRSNRSSDQKMNAGNLALQNSFLTRGEIRVIRGFTYPRNGTDKVYVYDGLHRVTRTWSEAGKSGYLVFKFQLERIANQVQTGTSIFNSAERIKNALLCGRRYLSPYMPMGGERLYRVTLFNNIDNDDGPMRYEYISTPTAYHQNHGHFYVDVGHGCRCVNGCSHDCSCITKNGGKRPYNDDGVLIRGKPLIYECGSSCMCSPDCRNRVSQKGLTKPFDVFKSSETGGWSVRSFNIIRAGSFICQYAGLVMTREDAQFESMIRDVELIDGNFFGDEWKEWGNVSNVMPSYVPPTHPPSPSMDFMIDLARSRNLASYMRHKNGAVAANVMVQKVVYNDNNFFYPRLALFAMENIPPMRELILDYGQRVNL